MASFHRLDSSLSISVVLGAVAEKKLECKSFPFAFPLSSSALFSPKKDSKIPRCCPFWPQSCPIYESSHSNL